MPAPINFQGNWDAILAKLAKHQEFPAILAQLSATDVKVLLWLFRRTPEGQSGGFVFGSGTVSELLNNLHIERELLFYALVNLQRHFLIYFPASPTSFIGSISSGVVEPSELSTHGKDMVVVITQYGAELIRAFGTGAAPAPL